MSKPYKPLIYKEKKRVRIPLSPPLKKPLKSLENQGKSRVFTFFGLYIFVHIFT
jgi:hypothetical protein